MASLEQIGRPGSEVCIWLSALHTSFCLGSKAWWLKLLECPRHCWIRCFSASVIHKFQFAELSQDSYFLEPLFSSCLQNELFLTLSFFWLWDVCLQVQFGTMSVSPPCYGLQRQGNTLLFEWSKLLLQCLTPGRFMQPSLASCVSIWPQAVALSNQASRIRVPWDTPAQEIARGALLRNACEYTALDRRNSATEGPLSLYWVPRHSWCPEWRKAHSSIPFHIRGNCNQLH